ncbi:MAG: hypothetical protein ACMXYL_05560 [Candidatus Woesearchaeota archaeon]
MEESLRDALSELKRSDHIYYVSLKYARTVDVIRNLVDRLIMCLEHCAYALAQKRASEGIFPPFPDSKPERAAMIMRLKEDPIGEPIILLLQDLRKIKRFPYERSKEFRKGVTMTVFMDSGIKEITTDTVKEYLDMTKYYFESVFKEIKGEDALL